MRGLLRLAFFPRRDSCEVHSCLGYESEHHKIALHLIIRADHICLLSPSDAHLVFFPLPFGGCQCSCVKCQYLWTLSVEDLFPILLGTYLGNRTVGFSKTLVLHGRSMTEVLSVVAMHQPVASCSPCPHQHMVFEHLVFEHGHPGRVGCSLLLV